MKQLLQESNGNFSSTRFVMYATAATVLLTYLAHNILAMVRAADAVDFTLNSAVVLGIAMTGKVAQKFAENGKKPPQ